MTEIHGPNRDCQQAMLKTWFTGYCSILIGIYMGILLRVSAKNVSDSNMSIDHNVDVSDASFFFVKFAECRKHPVCQEVGVISSATSRMRNAWYIATGKDIFRVKFGTNETSCNCTKIFKGTNSSKL